MEKSELKLYPLDDFINEEIGTAGSEKRRSFDAMVDKKIRDNKEKEAYHITMPIVLHETVSQTAAKLGRSVSDYISFIMARELNVAY